MVILEIAGVSFLAVWRESFWNSVSSKNLEMFIYYLSQFIGVVIGLVVVTGYRSYLINYVSLLIRTKLTNKALTNIKMTEGYRQRIQEDCRDYPLLSLTLITGLGSSIIQIIIFATIIIYQSTLQNLGIVVLYTIIGTIIASYIARPLIKLNYNNQVTEAAFRQDLTQDSYGKVFDNNYLLFIKLKYLQYFQAFFNQITVIVPLVILAPGYFAGKMLFGTLMQLSSCIGSIIEQGSYFINSFEVINRWLACRKRLKEQEII